MIDERRAEVVHRVIKSGGVRAAADAMRVDPAAVSRYLAKARIDVGLPLFERRGRSLVPTTAGLAISAYVEERQKNAGSLMARLDAMRGAEAGVVQMGVGEGYVAALVTDPIRRFLAAHPAARVELQMLAVDQIVAGLGAGTLDIGMAFNPAPATQMKLWARRAVHVQLIAPAGHPLLQSKRPLTLSDISGHAVGLFQPGYGLRKLVQSAEYLEGTRLEPVLETNSLSALRHFLLAGAGVTFLARSSVELECEAGLLGCARLKADLFAQSEVHLFTRDGAGTMPVVARLLELIIEQFGGSSADRSSRRDPDVPI